MGRTRRAFLRSGLASTVAAGAAAAHPTGAAGQIDAVDRLHGSYDPWVEVHAAHLRANAAAVHARAKRPVLAVIKNNGYGAGVITVARALEPLEAIAGFAVVKLHEAHTLRDAGIRKPVLLMGPLDATEIVDAVRQRIALMVYTPIARELERAAAAAGTTVDVHICVDTGLGRVGVPHAQAPELIRSFARAKDVRIAGTMMTFTEDEAFDREQLRRFLALAGSLKEVGLGRLHAASSYTLFQHPDAVLDMVRPGMVLYGVYPEAQFRGAGILDLTPAIALKARVAYVKHLQPGESAGYNRAYVAKAPVWIATLPVGHADGLPRVAAKGGKVRIGGALYPIVASVSASHTIAEIGAERRVAIGDEATLFDWADGSRPEDLAAACGASVYDLLMHLNPLMPRRVV